MSPFQNTAIWKTLELSNDATATSAGETLTFTGDVSGSYFNIGNNSGYASTISSTTLTSVTVHERLEPGDGHHSGLRYRGQAVLGPRRWHGQRDRHPQQHRGDGLLRQLRGNR